MVVGDGRNANGAPVALTVAGSDSGGGAGIQADLKTFAARKVFGASAITCLTAQNPDSVTSVFPVEPEFLGEQLLQVGRFFSLGAVKTGMLFSTELIEVVAAFFADRPGLPVVVDPVMVATSGAVLLQPDAVRSVRERLLPLAALITPNLDEAKVLLGTAPTNPDEMKEAAEALVRLFGRPVLLKGGHLPGDSLFDVLAEPGRELRCYEAKRIDDVDTHGSGCTLSAAIAAELAKGSSLPEAVEAARGYLRRTLHRAIRLGGRGFIHHGA